MNIDNTLKLLQGKHTIDSVAEEMNISISSALNLISRLRKEGYVKTSGGGRQKRVYTISTKKELRGGKNMFYIINKYSKNKIVPPFKHAAYGRYTIENALVDAILTKDFRTIHASLHLFNHIRNWKRLHNLAKLKGIERETGTLYEISRKVMKTRKMPDNILNSMKRKSRTAKMRELIPGLKTDVEELKKIGAEWKIKIPFAKKDLEDLR